MTEQKDSHKVPTFKNAPWTKTEEDAIKRLLERGYWINELSLVLKMRTREAIFQKVRRMGLCRKEPPVDDLIDQKALELLNV